MPNPWWQSWGQPAPDEDYDPRPSVITRPLPYEDEDTAPRPAIIPPDRSPSESDHPWRKFSPRPTWATARDPIGDYTSRPKAERTTAYALYESADPAYKKTTQAAASASRKVAKANKPAIGKAAAKKLLARQYWRDGMTGKQLLEATYSEFAKTAATYNKWIKDWEAELYDEQAA